MCILFSGTATRLQKLPAPHGLLTTIGITSTSIDSNGVKETELYEIKASEELLGFAKKNINDVLPELELRAMALKKIGDQSFMGIGVSSITQRKSFTKEYMEHAHGATLGWWNHTIEDGEDKCDPVALEEDTRATLKVLYDLATAKLLPYDFSDKISVFRANVQKVADKFGDHMDFTDLQDNLKTVEHQVNEIQAMKEGLSNEQAKLYNEFVKMVARQITNVTMTCADKYSQDSYGYTSLSYPIPLFADFERLVKLDPASLEYGLIKTQLVKNKNRINDALYIISQFATLYMKTSKR